MDWSSLTSGATPSLLPLLGGLHVLGWAATILAVTRLHVLSAVAAYTFTAASTYRILVAADASTLAYFASVLSGGTVLCAAVLQTSGSARRLASLKLLAGMLTQTSSAAYRILHVPETVVWYYKYVPTDAMVLGVVIVVPCMALAMCRRSPRPRPVLQVAAVHGLLTVATLSVQFRSTIDSTSSTNWLANAVYMLCTLTALLLSLDEPDRRTEEEAGTRKKKADVAEPKS